MTTIFKKTLTAAAAFVALTAAVAATAAPAEASWGSGGAFAAGAAVGLLGAGIAAHHHYNAPRYGYVEYGGACWRERREVYNRFGDFVGYRTIRVCN